MKKMPKFFDSARVRAHKNSAFAKILQGARPRALELYQKSSLALYDNLKDITKVFKRIAFVGPCSHYLLEMVAADNTISSFKPQALTICDPSKMSLEYSKQMQTKNQKVSALLSDCILRYHLLQDDSWAFEDGEFDLILSSMHMHNVNRPHQFMTKQLSSLLPDGALMGNTLGPLTLDQLRVSYLLAENERYGGISPHVSPLPEISDIGNMLGQVGFKIPTIVKQEELFLFQSPLDLMSFIQSIGQNSALLGSRKGIYKDLLMAMLAIYTQRFPETLEGQTYVKSTFQLVNFIAWKYSESQRKALQPGTQQVHMGDFIKEVQEQSDEPVQYGTIHQEPEELPQKKK